MSELLTHREGEVFALVSEGKTNKQIAQELCITVGTVKSHLIAIYTKLEVGTRTQAVLKNLPKVI